jgi:colicin import membrane protein
MFEELLRYPRALGLSVLFHFVIIIAIVINFQFIDKPKLLQTGTQAKTIQARVIDSKQFEESKQKKNTQIADQRKRELEKIALLEKVNELKQKKELEKKRSSEAQKEKLEKQKKEAQEKEIAVIKKKKEAREKAKLKAQEKVKSEEKAAIKKEKEIKARAKKIEEDRRLAEAAKKKQLAEEKEKQEADKRRLAEQDQKRKELALEAQLEAEESSRQLSTLKQKYINDIRRKIERSWRRPQQSVKIESCEVKVLQGPGGIILDVTFGDCNGGTNAYRASIENAVYKAEPLPEPGDDVLFERKIIFIFNPK